MIDIYTVDVEFQLSWMILSDAGPSISTRCYLLEMDQIVSGRSITVVVKLETIAAQSCLEFNVAGHYPAPAHKRNENVKNNREKQRTVNHRNTGMDQAKIAVHTITCEFDFAEVFE